jgi:hypothetical protein
MRGRRVLVVMASVSAVLGAGGLTASQAMSAGTVRAADSWGKAIPVPGLAALGGGSDVFSVSCGLAGDCAAAGAYRVRGHSQGFIASERKGRWGKARKVPEVSALYAGRGAAVSDVSCFSAGNCAAGGYYRDRSGHDQGFVVVERRGRWSRVIEVPGLGGLNKGGDAGVSSLSCTSAGGCTAVGGYADKARHDQVFVVVERDGRWGPAVELPGLAALGGGDLKQVSCASAGSCAAGGSSSDGAGNGTGWVAAEKNGVWGKAIEPPGLGSLNKGDAAEVNSVSCGAAGSCAAVGDYTDNGDNGQGWVAVEKNGVWGKAIEPPGLAALNGDSGGGNAEVESVSCPSAGDCAAVGTYGDPYGTGFVTSEKNGVWGKATDVGVIGGRIADAGPVSCASAGNCAAGGFYSNDSGSVNQAWVSAERNGRWDDGFEVPGLGVLNKGGAAETETMSCPSAGRCVAGGSYLDPRGQSRGFVVSQTG